MDDPLSSLAVAIRGVNAAEELYPLAATANAMLATTPAPGPVLVVHLALLQIARLADGEAMAETEWQAIRKTLDRLADFVEHCDAARLDALGMAWRGWRQPAALQ